MIYFLMHENTRLALFTYDGIGISSVRVSATARFKLPLFKNDHISIEKKLYLWFLSRCIPVTRKGIQLELHRMNRVNALKYLAENLALSLVDHYWICPVNSQYNWENINLYTNAFKSSFSLNLYRDHGTLVPNAALRGDLQKKWIIDQYGNRLLVKGNYNNTCRQSLCKVLATEIHQRQNRFEYVPYNLIRISADDQIITGCSCPNFTSPTTEFIPAFDLLDSVKVAGDTSYYEAYISLCAQNGIPEKYMRSFMEYQTLTDFIISNTDRHLNNFGVIRDSDSFRFLKPAPIFDSGNSMFYNTGRIKTGNELLNIPVTSFKKFEVKLLEYVTDPTLVNLDALPTADEVQDLFSIDTESEPDVPAKLAKAYSAKIDFLRQLQGGTKIYSYSYLNSHGIHLKAEV